MNPPDSSARLEPARCAWGYGRWLPHEVWFGLFLAVSWVRLTWKFGVGDRDALIYLGWLAVGVWAVAWCERRPSPARWRWRLLTPVVAMNFVFLHMKTAIPRLCPVRFDGVLHGIDVAWLGQTPAVALQPLVHPAFTECFSFCYLLFFPYLLLSLGQYFLGDLAEAKRLWSGLFTIYGLGFLGYSIVPAAGPWVAFADRFTVPLKGGWIARWNDAVVQAGSNGVDVFPSLHCAVSAFLLGFDRRHKRWRYRVCLVPCVGLWLSTLYLRYHYLIDVVCGFVLAALALAIALRTDRPRP